MANTLTGNTWALDTANATTVIDDRMVYIKSIRWDDATTLNHKVQLTDKLGGVIFQSTAAGPDNEDFEIVEGWFDGLILPTLASGTLLVRLG